jgi:nitrous oxidase accessory protein
MRLDRNRSFGVTTVGLAIGLATVTAACRPVEALPAAEGAPAALAPARPASCIEATPADSVQSIADSAKESDSICLAPGIYQGPLRVVHGITVWGPRTAVIRSTGLGTTVRLDGRGARLLGITVDGSGGRFDQTDAAVRVGADDVTVEGIRVEHAVFGILVEKANRARVAFNEVAGNASLPHGLRGDTIRLWETRDSLVEGNIVHDGRDVVVWYSPGNRILRNTFERGRYGAHLMYSSGVTVEGNRSVANVVGLFVMYSRNVTVRGNLLAGSAGAAGIGLGCKESGNLSVERNLFLRDTIGVYLDTTPLQEGDVDAFADNSFRLDDVAVMFHSGQRGNRFTGNSFHDNRSQVAVEGGGDALGSAWDGNDFDDYAGYDLDGDGVGDIPYELRSLSAQLGSRAPAIKFFDGAPALAMVDAAARILPLFRPKTLLVDAHPRVGPAATARSQEGSREARN